MVHLMRVQRLGLYHVLLPLVLRAQGRERFWGRSPHSVIGLQGSRHPCLRARQLYAAAAAGAAITAAKSFCSAAILNPDGEVPTLVLIQSPLKTANASSM
jgi:hypothetical protein